MIGLALLTSGALEGLWTQLYNSTVWCFERFNNSIVMGSLVLSLAGFVPLYVLSNAVIRKYRAHILAWVQKTRLMEMFKASKLYHAYQAVSGFGGGS